jgi:FixJ family two-component response regulator
MNKRILCVDDEPNILFAFARQLRKFEIVTALGPELGLRAMEEQGPFAVVVSDLRMPQMSGVQFLLKVKEMSPDTVRIMLTGDGDLPAAAAAVNQGNIFRFLLKPCPTEVLSAALDAGLEQYRLVNVERTLLEDTLRRSVEVMADILSLANREAFGQAHRLRRYVRHISATLALPERWQYEVAALLSQIGSIAVPPEILDKLNLGEPLTIEERKVYASRWQVAHDLVAKIPRLEVVAKIVQNLGNASPPPAGASPDDPAVLGSRMLRLAIGLDELVMDGAPLAAAIARLKGNKAHDPAMLAALETMAEGEGQIEICSIRIAKLRVGMVLHSDVQSRSGVLLLGKGQEITPSVIARLRGFAASASGVIEPLTVAVRTAVPIGPAD